MNIFYKLNEGVVKFFDEEKEKELDGIAEQGAIDFKNFIIERYYFIFLYKKDNKEIQKKYFRLMNKYLKNETEEIGRNKLILIIIHNDKISELYFRVLNELLIYLNDNLKRIEDIWKININLKPEKNKIKNSLEILHIYTGYIYTYYKKYTANKGEKPENHGASIECSDEFRKQERLIIDNMKYIISFVKEIILKEKIDNNTKNNVLERFLLFLYQIFTLFLRIKAVKTSKITKEEAEIMCQSSHFMIKNGTQNSLIDSALKFFSELISFSNLNVSQIPDQQNFFFNELFINWKVYFNYELYVQNKYCSEYKINSVLNYLIRFYGYCFKDNPNNPNNNITLFKNIYGCIQEDNYTMVKKLIEKLNDFEVSFENKLNIMLNLILCFFDSEKNKLSFNDLYFIMNQLTGFFQILYSLNKNGELIGTFLKEEKQIIKDNYQKDMLKINTDNTEENKLIYERYNLNGIFYNLTKNKYDKYICIKDVKILFDILKFLQCPQNIPNSEVQNPDFISKIINQFKIVLTNKENSIDDTQKSYIIDKIASIFSKFFFYYFYIYEKLKANHQIHDNNEQNKILDIYIKGFTYDNEYKELFVAVFTKLMPYIFKLYKQGLKICPNKLCISAKLVHNIFKNIKDEKAREKVFQIYFEYFSFKIYETGNPMEYFDKELKNTFDESINNITILKSIFFNLFESITDFNYFKNSIIPLVIDILYLSKNSEYYGNYIYILRCFFKYLKTAINSFNSISQQDHNRQNERAAKKRLNDDFNIEINYILYAILKYLVNIKEKAPFFNEMISEIIMILPVKQRFLIEIPHLIFPSLIDNLSNGNGSDNIQLNLINLENWMNVYIKNAESVVPFIQKYLSKITDLLSNNLLGSMNINICLASLKWLSKLGGKGRNYFKEKRIISKTCPMQILTMKLKEKKENRNMDFILDYIIDIDIDNCINWSSKTMHKKGTTNSDKKLIFNYIEIYKNCLAAFFHKKIDYNYILEIKKNIINGVKNFNEKEFNSEFSFRQMNEKNSKIKINNFFRKKEHFIIGKIITGYFLINSSYIQIQNLQKDEYFLENDLMKFISNYFLMILLSKEKNNKNILLYEQDPILFLDEIIQFLFSSHPTIIKNTNVQLTEYSLKIINNIIDSIIKFFDNDNNIIKDLEIVDIIYMKFLNCCYINDSPKIDLGLMLIKVLLQKFDKCINFKYLKYFFKCISSVSSNYSNIVNIQFKKGCNNLVEVVEYLINMFIINDPNYDSLTEQDFDNVNNDFMFIEENEETIKITKNNFIMLFEFVKYCFDEIVEKIDSENNYTRNVGIYFVNKIIGKIPRLKKLVPHLLQLDLDNFTIKDFINYYKNAKPTINYRSILSKVNNNTMDIDNNKANDKENKDYILPNFQTKKIYKKLENIFNTLTKKLGLRETSFDYLITCSNAFNNLFEISPCLIKEYIFSINSDTGKNNVELYLQVIESLYINILLCYFNYCQISIYFKNFTESFKSRLVYLFMEQLLVEKNLEHNYEIKDECNQKIILKNEVPSEYIKYVENYIKDSNNTIYRNEVNTRDNIVAEIFENLGLKINMVINYIKLLNNIFSKTNKNFTEKETENEFNKFNEYKKKTTTLIFLQVLNLHTSSIIKQCSKFMCNIFKDDENLKKEIFNTYKEKISGLISLITLEEIKQSNCAIIQDMISNLQKENMTSLMIISKSMGLNEALIADLKPRLKHFDNIPGEKFENSQIVLFYGYISIFLYVDISNDKDFIYKIFEQILFRIKEKLAYPSKNLLSFTKTNYGGNVIKLIAKYSKYFSEYIIRNSVDKIKNKYILELIKTIIYDKSNNVFCETIFKEITNEFKKEILKKYNEDDYKNDDKLLKVAQLLKICRKIAGIFRIYLKSTSLLEVIDDQIKYLMSYYDKNIGKCNKNNIYQKIFKNWVHLHMIYIETFHDKEFSFNSLFFYMSLPNTSYIQKNNIDFLLIYQINLLNGADYEKIYKSILNSFMTLNDNIKKYFDLYVEKLIIPLMINFYKSRNFFNCYNITFNNESLDIDKKDNENDINNINEIKKEEKKINFDEEYFLDILEKLTSGIYKIKFKKEKKEENKYKLVCLLIVLYKEYLSQKNINKDYSQRLKNIHYNIQALLSFSPLYENNNLVGLWRIYLFFGICLFTDEKTKEEKNNLEIIFNFNRKLNEDFGDIHNLIYELILPHSTNDITLFNLYKCNIAENPSNGINFLKIIIKFPSIINNIKNYVIKDLLNSVYEMMGRSKNLVYNKKIFMQIIGLFTLFISKTRNKKLNQEQEKNRLNLEPANFTIAFRFYRYIIQYLTSDPEIFDIMKKLLVYFREICDTDAKISFNFEYKFQDLPKLIHIHVQMLRICFYNLGYDSLYINEKNLGHYFTVNKYMIDNNINHRIFNDYMLIFRLLIDSEVLFKLNKRGKLPEIYLIEFKRKLMDNFKEIIKDKNYMKDKFTNYEIKDYFSSNRDSEMNDITNNLIIRKVTKYLIEKKYYPDPSVNPNANVNIQNNIMNNNNLNQVNVGAAPQLQTLSSTDAQSEINPRNRRIDIQVPPQPVQPVQPPQPITQEKWMETFHIYEFKNFIFYRKFMEKFFAEIPSMIQTLNMNILNNNINVPLGTGNNNQINLNLNPNDMKADLENRFKTQKETMELVESYTFSFFENFYYFTLFFLQEYTNFYKKGYIYNNPLGKEVKEYFNSTHNFFYNLRNYEDLAKIREEPIEIIINDKDKEREQQNKFNKKYFFYMLSIYPDIILSSFLFFIQCDEIMKKYYNAILELFLYTYRYFRDKFYEPLLEYIVKEIMNNKILKNMPAEKNKFMLKFLKSYDQLNPYKVVRTTENIINIFKNYLEYYLTEPNFNKKDPNILKSLRIILYVVAKFELQNRKPIFELIKCYIGNKLIDSLKWIFTFDENEVDVYYFIYFETIPLSIDFFLSYFDDETTLLMNENNFSKFKNLNKFKSPDEKEMEIEDISKENEINTTDMEKYDKNQFIKKMVDSCNLITKEKKVSALLDPIRSIITAENSSYYKIFVVIFTQIWKMLSSTEREILNMYINEFFYRYTAKQKDRNNMIINLLLGAFTQCSPMIIIKPIIIQSLIQYQNFWSTNILYLENLLINGIDVPNTYNSLINVFNSLKEDGLCNGLRYHFSDNKTSKEGYGELQAKNYLNAEKIFYGCFEKLNEVLKKIENINVDDFNLEDENSELFNELSSWEDGLIECYESNDNWTNIIELSDKVNNNDLKLKSLWHYGNEKWQELDEFVKSIFQYSKTDRSLERYNLKNSYIAQINEIYSIFKKLIEENQGNENNNINAKCQNTCMKCIQNIYQNFSSLHPKNLEIIDYYYFLIFQLAVESWESTNTLNDIIKKLRENNPFNFKDNLLLWRERLPHYCEGYNALRNVLEPRNYLFKTIQDLINNRANENPRYLPYYSDKVWTDMIFMKYARKLGLIETFYKKNQQFEEENKDMLKFYPYEIYLKEIECIKLIRNNTYNYDLGIKMCNESINKYQIILDDNNKDFIDFVCNDFKRHKAYFYYKQGKIIEAHNLFTEASVYKNKECTDYHLYNDWGEMCEEIAKLTIENEEGNEWFDNTIHNYIYMIIYKLDKAKFVIPKMIDFIKEFEKGKLKNKFNEDLDEIPTWIWLFWLPVLFENLNYYQNNEEKSEFFFYILKKIAYKYQQMFYYPYKVNNKIIGEKTMGNLELDINKKYKELYNIITAENKYSHFIDKIEIIINELSKKEENNRENSLNSILKMGENNTFRTDNISNLKEFFKKVATFLGSFPDLTYLANDMINLIDSPDVTRKQLRDFIIKNKYYIHNLIVTENKYEKLSKIIDEKLYNTDFTNIEVPGFFSNKIIEPNEQNTLYISKLESEYSYKLITDARTKVIMRCSNDKLMSFIVENQDADNNIDKKIYIMQILFNYIFEKNYETYKRKVKFYIPIKYFISSKIKIIEEDIYYKYNMDEIYEYCLQKRGYYPHIAYQIFEEEGRKNNLDSNFLYYSEINNEKLFNRMCQILPQDSLKNFIHKFILTSEDILLFRKQFTISYSINNLMNFIILDNVILKNISFNKETGLCVFNTDLTTFPLNEYKELEEQKSGTPLRLTKNINYFLNMTSIYGIIPGVFNFSCKALLNKPKILKSILKICLDNNCNIYKNIDIIANNYMNKFKYVINIMDDSEYFPKNLINKSLENNADDNNIMNENEIKRNNNNGNMKNIFELIDNSMNDNKLMRKSIDYEAWF